MKSSFWFLFCNSLIFNMKIESSIFSQRELTPKELVSDGVNYFNLPPYFFLVEAL